jgi:FMN phosphatase YigB (HAD superfamily)
VFLFDVDNTLLDNDRVSADLRKFLENTVGHERQERYWAIFEQLRSELGYADYLGALQRYREEYPRGSNLLALSHFLLEYPFANRLFPKSLEAVDYANQLGEAVILSDGDVVFQPHKVYRSGLFEAFCGKALIYVHKEKELDDVAERFPAEHYVFIDDKLRLLAAVKQVWRDKVTTVFPRQGHYALDPNLVAAYPAADITIERIGEVLTFDLPAFVAAAGTCTQSGY